MTDSVWSAPPATTPERARGSWLGALGWFFGGAMSTVLVGAMSVAAAESSHSLGLLLFAGGFFGGVWVATRLPTRHGIAYICGGVALFVAAVTFTVIQLFSQPWHF